MYKITNPYVNSLTKKTKTLGQIDEVEKFVQSYKPVKDTMIYQIIVWSQHNIYQSIRLCSQMMKHLSLKISLIMGKSGSFQIKYMVQINSCE